MAFTESRYRFAIPGEVEIGGWLRTQLETEAAGLSGNLDKMWPDVRDSHWIGGNREGWERVPYWLDGFIPLAYLLRNEDMIARAKKYVDAILRIQQEDGWICPCAPENRSFYDMWALLLLSKVLVGYADAEPSYADRIEDALMKAFRQAADHFAQYPLFDWGKHRWYEGLVAVFWLYERNHDEFLVSFAKLLHDQGRNYKAFIREDFEPYKTPIHEWKWETHIVNLGMALKAETMWEKVCGTDPEETDAFSIEYYQTLYQYHGMPAGMISGDECLSGRSPVQGAELCSVVEMMYSCEWNLAISGNPFWGDLLERLAFNAFPATTSTDMWTHQYDQQTNQIACVPEAMPSIFTTNSRAAHIFGLEPNYGCCTANMPQGWPKFALSVFMKNDKGIFSAVPAPATVSGTFGSTAVKVTCDTRYPFEDSAIYRISAEQPVRFALDIRIPGSAKHATVNGEEAKAGSIYRIEKEWHDGDTVNVTFDFDMNLSDAGYADLRCLNRGSLLFALPIRSQWIETEHSSPEQEAKYPYCDYYLFPKSSWEYGFAGEQFELCRRGWSDSAPVFDEKHPPLVIRAKMYPIDWGKLPWYSWICAETPKSETPSGSEQTVSLIPYGCTNLRMTAMPVIPVSGKE